MPEAMRWRLPRQTSRNLALRILQGPADCERVMKPFKKRLQAGPVLVSQEEPEISWRDYPRIEPGEYSAYCQWGTRYYDRGYRRWTFLLRFVILKGDLLTQIAKVPCWLPLGKNRERPFASRRGKYLKEWLRAKGGPPTRCARLSPRVFLRRIARVEVGDTDLSRSPVPYSVVRKILSSETGSGPGHSVNKSHSQGRHESNGPDPRAYEK